MLRSQKMGADRLEEWIGDLDGKRIGLVVNQTSCLSNNVHLLDALLERGVKVTTIFAPEHGFRGTADAGVPVKDGTDVKTGIPIISLYGQNKRPNSNMLKDVDILIFDIQDVGARFYTYTSTLFYVMDSASENNKSVIVLDRPNPHDVVDGSILNPNYKSLVGLLPIPVLHGVTVGELSRMINGEKWLSNRKECSLKVIPMIRWKHGQSYSLPIKPSPNLPNDLSIALYPSLCFFEGTIVSVGRGTETPFQIFGAPNKVYGNYCFTPIARVGFDNNPIYKNQVCYGVDLRDTQHSKGIDLSYLISMYRKTPNKGKFFLENNFINLLAGSSILKEQIIAGKSEVEIRESWQVDLMKYRKIRKKYLLYDDYLKSSKDK